MQIVTAVRTNVEDKCRMFGKDCFVSCGLLKRWGAPRGCVYGGTKMAVIDEYGRVHYDRYGFEPYQVSKCNYDGDCVRKRDFVVGFDTVKVCGMCRGPCKWLGDTVAQINHLGKVRVI